MTNKKLKSVLITFIVITILVTTISARDKYKERVVTPELIENAKNTEIFSSEGLTHETIATESRRHLSSSTEDLLLLFEAEQTILLPKIHEVLPHIKSENKTIVQQYLRQAPVM